MLTLKKLQLVTISTLLLLPLNAFAFSDVDSSHPNAEAIEAISEEKIIQGYEDETFKPDDTINRAEFVKILIETIEAEDVAGSNCYPDISDQWYAPYVCYATAQGYVKGNPDGLFRPSDDINFVEAAKIMVKALDIEIGSDEETTPDTKWYEEYVRSLDVYSATPTSIEDFDHPLTRAEMTEMVWRITFDIEDQDYRSFDDIINGTTTYYDPLPKEPQPTRIVSPDLTRFESCNTFNDYYADALYYYDDFYWSVEPAVLIEEDSVGTTSSQPRSELGGGGDELDYSETNIQVQGVDEADYIKTDGNYIYVLTTDSIKIIKSYPADDMEEVGSYSFQSENFSPREMYLDGDQVVVIGWSYDNDIFANELEYAAWDTTEIMVLDVENRENPKIERTLKLEGYYVDSRKVNDQVYIVSNTYSKYDTDPSGPEVAVMPTNYIPHFFDSDTGEIEPLADCEDVLYADGRIDSNFVSISTFSIKDHDGGLDSEVIFGSGDQVYASKDHLYLTEPNYAGFIWGDFIEDVTFESPDYESAIFKFSLGEEVEYQSSGVVPGTPLNQFSMDEYDGNFRIATTNWDDKTFTTVNNLYVFDENLDRIGTLEGLAPDESIFSARFIGDRAYIVTFEQIDPLFVIGLSDPRNPKVLGELKIPGFSNYLHPVDEDHLLGFGLDAIPDEEWGFAWFQGVKVALFDVSDVENPKEKYVEIIGDRGSSTPLRWDHKALLFNSDTGLLSLPVTVYSIPQEVKDDPEISDGTYGEITFQGAYVYDLDVDSGFDLRGTVSHYDEDQLGNNFEFYYDGSKDINRVLYIEDVLYTLSNTFIQANDLDDLDFINNLEVDNFFRWIWF